MMVRDAEVGASLDGGYSVQIAGSKLPIYRATSCQAPWPFAVLPASDPRSKIEGNSAWGVAQIGPAGNAPYWFCCAAIKDMATFRISGPRPLDPSMVLPVAHRSACKTTVSGDLLVQIDQPTKLAITPEGRDRALLLFVDAPAVDVPDASSPDVIYFGAGVHKPGLIELHDNQTLYLAAGAIAKGGIRARGARNLRICGRGILCGEDWNWRQGPQTHMVMFEDCEHIRMEDIVIRGSWQWTIRPRACKHLVFDNIKICGGRNLNDDGIDPDSSSDVRIENCFIRTQDDCISIKAHSADRRPCERIDIRGCVLWSDLSRIVMVGPESHADRIGDFSMQDCEVWYTAPCSDAAGFTSWPGRAPVFFFEAGENCLMDTFRFRDIRVAMEGEQELFRLESTVNHFMQIREPGAIHDVSVENLIVSGDRANGRIVLKGLSAQKSVSHVQFKNCAIRGIPFFEIPDVIEMGSFVDRVRLF